jgi:hypothetical protein
MPGTIIRAAWIASALALCPLHAPRADLTGAGGFIFMTAHAPASRAPAVSDTAAAVVTMVHGPYQTRWKARRAMRARRSRDSSIVYATEIHAL